MQDVLSREGFDALIKDLEARVDAELKKRQAQRPILVDEIELEREAIVADIASKDETASLWDTLVEVRDALKWAELYFDTETSPAHIREDMQELRDLIVDLESAVDKYDPS